MTHFGSIPSRSSLSTRLVQISDPHLAADDPATARFLAPALDRLRQDPPAAVMVTGDIVREDPDATDDHHLAAELFASTGVPTYALPGNHDVGEAGVVPWEGPPVTEARLARFVATWGADRWSLRVGPWLILGLNAMVDETTLPDEASAQAGEVADLLSGHTGPVGVFTHKPFLLHGGSSPDPAGYVADLSRLLRPAADAVRFVASGHLHRGIVVPPSDGVPWTRVWCPSTQFVGREDWNCGAVLGRGWAEYDLHDDGSFTPYLVWADD